MEKVLAGAIAGIFVGALVMEILNRKKPELTKEIEKKAKSAVDSFVAAFKEGWRVEEEETESIQPEETESVQPEGAPA